MSLSTARDVFVASEGQDCDVDHIAAVVIRLLGLVDHHPELLAGREMVENVPAEPLVIGCFFIIAQSEEFDLGVVWLQVPVRFSSLIAVELRCEYLPLYEALRKGEMPA